ncbi:MAG: leucyl aminopeptidase [Deltaproteobacteria bacterium]|nr:leucyl aminopeptidase [Deltaproteobacteria bacterium]
MVRFHLDSERGKADLWVFGVFEGAVEKDDCLGDVDKAVGGLVFGAARDEEFVGKEGQELCIHTHGRAGGSRVALVGLGKAQPIDMRRLRNLGGRALKIGERVSAGTMTIFLPGAATSSAGALSHVAVAEGLSSGVVLGGYKFDKYLSKEKKGPKVRDVRFHVHKLSKSDFHKGVDRGTVIAESVLFARDLVNEPAGEMTPRRLADTAHRVAREGKLSCTILGPGEMKKLGMGLLLGVARGSAEEPRFVHMTYAPAKPRKGARRIAIVGKGITFDSGGLSLKTAKQMEEMKMDMSGAAVVISTMRAISRIRPGDTIMAFAAITENMPGGRAIKPGDILRGMSGKTVEVLNTDAEGRLVLGDALAYARTKKPDVIIDLATLTGACMIALGKFTAGVLGTDEKLSSEVLASARAAGEEMWPLPLPERMFESIKSPIADMKNVGDGFGGAIAGGLFLKEFAGDTPWVHLDIAGPAMSDAKSDTCDKGATGFGVLTLCEMLAPRG